ncbi:MAG: tRNA (cytidine(34)-2'-O)-methyltransferase [Defluviitaleaceae bacterium]|nr:tRNA (cytidine(34)-2'-O)-methyltransferase [Defluviitaleaceae bacterium]
MNIVLHEPEIPANTGNIGRTCAAVGAALHLIKPLGFSIDDKTLKRAGMDYWPLLSVSVYENFEDFILKKQPQIIFMSTTKAKKCYAEINYPAGAYIMFGKESAGIPEEILLKHQRTAIRIPMLDAARSLNLSSSVAVVLYEALRQNNFSGLQKTGELHRNKWDENL